MIPFEHFWLLESSHQLFEHFWLYCNSLILLMMLCWMSWTELVFEVNLSIFILLGDVMESELFCVIVIWLICVWLWVHCSKRCSKLGFFLRYCSWLLEWNSYFGWCLRDSVFIVLNWVSCWSIVLDFWHDILILADVILRGMIRAEVCKWYIVTWPVWLCVVYGAPFSVRISKSSLGVSIFRMQIPVPLHSPRPF